MWWWVGLLVGSGGVIGSMSGGWRRIVASGSTSISIRCYPCRHLLAKTPKSTHLGVLFFLDHPQQMR